MHRKRELLVTQVNVVFITENIVFLHVSVIHEENKLISHGGVVFRETARVQFFI